MVSIKPIAVSLIKKGAISSKKITLPKETTLIHTTNNVKNEKVKFSSCGGLDTLCSIYNMF